MAKVKAEQRIELTKRQRSPLATPSDLPDEARNEISEGPNASKRAIRSGKPSRSVL